MNLYLVRLQDSAELVGLFLSPDVEALWRFVDECCDPFVCEYVELPPGGIYLDGSGAPRVPTVTRYPVDQDEIPDWFAGATLSELWIPSFHNTSTWSPILPTDG